MAEDPSGGKYAYIPPGSVGATPSVDIPKSSLPYFAQVEGAQPRVPIEPAPRELQPRKVQERAEKGRPGSTCTANCSGEANTGSTAPPEKTKDKYGKDVLDQIMYPAAIGALWMYKGYEKTKNAAIYFYNLPKRVINASDSYAYYQRHPPTTDEQAAEQGAALDTMIEGSVETALSAGPASIVGGIEKGGVVLGSGPIIRGEPVSVATGEYLETWHDFLIPATLPFDGARYMGLKLPLPAGYASPLGPCQISMFDEIVANPEPGQLDFHQADGKVVRFDRPFNFLASHNAGCPHLDLRAPWLRQLELRDRRLIKHFRQDEDDIYRLVRIEDLDGHAITFLRDADGVLERAEGTDGLALAFTNDERGCRTGITLIGTNGSRLDLAHYAYDAKGRMTEADCAFGMSVAYLWSPTATCWPPGTTAPAARSRASPTTPTAASSTPPPTASGTTTASPTTGTSAKRPTCPAAPRPSPSASPTTSTTTSPPRPTPSATPCPAPSTPPASRPPSPTPTATPPPGPTTSGATRRASSIPKAAAPSTAGAGRPARPHRRRRRPCPPLRARRTRQRRRGDRRRGERHPLRARRGRAHRPHHLSGWKRGAAQLRRVRAAFHPHRSARRHHDVCLRRFRPPGRGHRSGRPHHPLRLRGGRRRIRHPHHPGASRRGERQPHLCRGRGAGLGPRRRGPDLALRLRRLRRAPGDRGSPRRAPLPEPRRRGPGDRGHQPDRSCLPPDPRRRRPGGGGGGFRRPAHHLHPRPGRAGDADAQARRVAAHLHLRPLRPAHRDPHPCRRRPGGGAPADETHLRYDGRGLLVEASSRAARVVLERDGNGRIVAETTNGRRVESRLDGLGRRIERRIGAGQPGASLVRIGRDPLGALASLTIDDHAPLAFSRDPLGRETRRASSKGFVLEQAFDPVGQLRQQRAGRDGRAGRAYAWDEAGAPTLIDDALFGPAAYRYDGNGQVAQASFGESLIERFDYDAARNVVGVLAEGSEAGEILGALRRVEATPGGAVRVGHGPHGERVALTHDACGRVIERRVERKGFRPRTWRYGWDVQDRLVRCETPEGEVWHYRYDAFGRRLSKVRSSRRPSGRGCRAGTRRWCPRRCGLRRCCGRGPSRRRATGCTIRARRSSARSSCGTGTWWRRRPCFAWAGASIGSRRRGGTTSRRASCRWPSRQRTGLCGTS